MSPGHLTLVIPHLLGPLPPQLQQEELAFSTPALCRLLTLAAHLPDYQSRLEDKVFPRFGIDRPVAGDWPVGALGAAHELAEIDGGYWLRADPVFLRADRSRLILFGPEVLAITAEEAADLAASINDHYAAEGWQLRVAAPDRWYLRLPRAPVLATTPLRDVIGRHIDPFLPGGDDARHWHGLLNELQMLLHAHPVNERRAGQGRPAINSLWLWGGGTLPTGLRPLDAWCCSDDMEWNSLAAAAGLSLQPQDRQPLDWLPEALGSGPGLAVLESLSRALQTSDFTAWNAALQRLEAEWFGPLLELRRSGVLHRLHLIPMNGAEYVLSGKRWWEGVRSTRGLRDFIT